jgi:hypothetical protein
VGEERTSTFTIWAEPSAEQAKLAERADALRKLASKGFEELGKVESVGRGLLSDERGRLWRLDPTFDTGRDPSTHAVYVGEGLEVVWLVRPTEGPRTFDELAKRQERQAKAAAEHERGRQKRLAELRKTAVPVTSAHVERRPALTLAEAGERVRNAGGTFELMRGDRLLVRLPRRALGSGLGSAMRAAATLYLGEDEVTRCLMSKAELPDRAVLPTGALAPE